MGDRLDKGRVEWIDIAKGFTMLLVIAGHSVTGWLRGLIFSFHMPLFFILSGLTFRCSCDDRQLWRRCKKAAAHLLIPAAVLIGADILVEILGMLLDGRASELGTAFWTGKGLTLLFSSGSTFYIGDQLIGRVGIPWFLIALFLGRTSFDLLHLKLGKWSAPACVILTVAGVLIGQWLWLPLSLDVAMSSLLFLLVGHWLQRADLTAGALKKMIVAGAVWCGGVLIAWWLGARYLEMAARHYGLFPVCYVIAVAGTLMVSEASILCDRYLPVVKRPLAYLGEHSLVLLCVHTLDHLWEGFYQGISSDQFVTAILRVITNILVFLIVMWVKNEIRKLRRKGSSV